MVAVDTGSIELTRSQLDVLSTLVTLYDRAPVKGREIAAELDRSPGTIRMQMQTIRPLGLVEGIPGPKGGYKPTPATYELLDVDWSDVEAAVPLFCEGEPVEGVTVTEFDLINLHHPDRHEAEVSVHGRLSTLARGDAIVIGPTPATKLVVSGVIDGIDRSADLLFIDITDVDVEDGDE